MSLFKQSLAKIIDGENLERGEAEALMGAMMEGEVPPSQIAAALTGLRVKGETVDELTGLASAMRDKAARLPQSASHAVDTCGTGGDGGKTFNISTAAAIVAAAAGVPVAKHGNRAVSSRSGSADVLEALGVPTQLSPEDAVKALDKQGICFLFAPLFHQAMKHVMPVRRELGFRTCFNLLGPLSNPAGVKRQLVGVYDPALTEPVAEVLTRLGAERVLVVAGLEGIDEISVSGETRISESREGRIRTFQLTPEELGLTRHPLAALAGGDAVVNASIIRGVLRGEPGAPRDVVTANAGAVLYLAGHAASLQEGVEAAAAVIDQGGAEAKLAEMKGAFSHVS
ncbi:anthranilate phosphoribosyltransferase [Desmospora profundinema]|uniref:Anthranilate phosphoribosyltransferase n=1 Tax=Desmospora profundinema TaxID=1571184 RepID=A0ABU1IIX0_9BACL|nr:anthranilate phosphoribosyltransferase [Desmospora profundinema]MDR6224497.1 anthranilate phosphoribosyltransferase [Desmospora profundinema]